MGTDLLSDLAVAFSAHRDQERARAMSAYMRDRFEYYGLPAPVQRTIAREVLANHPAPPDEATLKAIALACFERPEREWQYFACDLVARYVRLASPRFLSTAKKLLTTKSWWDTVDGLSSRTVGGLVRLHPQLAAQMDKWIDDRDFWVARAALLHQLSYRDSTDRARLFAYCERRASDKEFFIRKAIGWALREYSKTDERAVRAFVRTHDAELSGLSKREALKWFERRSAHS